MMKKIFTGVILAGLPAIVMAQANVFSILGVVTNVAKILIPLGVTAAVVFTGYNVVRYIGAKDADKSKDARGGIVRGLIGLGVFLSIWGIIGVVQSTFGIGAGGSVGPDSIPNVDFR